MKRWRIPVLLIIFFFFSFWLYLDSHYAAPILMYHSLDESRVDSYAAVSTDVFYRQMKFIKDLNYKVITLDQYCEIIAAHRKIPHNVVVITFDDGEKNTLRAVKILEQLNFPATIFLIVDRIGEEGFLSLDDIRWFLANTRVGIGSHTIHHTYLPSADQNLIKSEIVGSKRMLEAMFDVPVTAIAYPTGGFDQRVLGEVRSAGYACGCTTNRSFSKRFDLFALSRIKITNKDSGIKLWFKLSGFYNFFKNSKKPY